MQGFKDFLTEAVNYKDIFNSLWKAVPGLVGHTESFVDGEIKWARQTLKKQDRITWYLVWIRTALIDEWAVDKIREKEYQKIVAANPNIDPELVSKYTRPFYKRNLSSIKGTLEHFFSMNIPKIEKYQFKNYVTSDKIYSEFSVMDREWSEGHQGTIKYSLQPLEHHDPYGDSAHDQDSNPIGQSRKGISIVKQFANDYYWVNLKQYSCRLEANAMGHCGNTASGQQGENILSFRKLIKKSKDENHWFWEPHLTFILDKNGFLGEMKGRANEKPDEKYHKYIIALLEDPIIKGIKGGGYAPERNFDITDLSEEQQNKLYDKKPGLMGIKEYFKRHGKTDELIEKIETAWNDMVDTTGGNAITLVWDDSKEHAAFAKFKDVHDFVEEYGDDTAKWCSEALSGGDGFDFFDGIDSSYVQDVLDMLDTKKVEARMAEKFPDEWEEEGDDAGLLDFIERWDDELYEALRIAAEDGLRSGAENDMMDDFKSGVEDFEIIGNDSEDEIASGYIPKNHFWDEPFFLYISFKHLMDLVTDDEARESGITFKVNVEQPYYGWSGWDEEAVKEYMKQEYADLF